MFKLAAITDEISQDPVVAATKVVRRSRTLAQYVSDASVCPIVCCKVSRFDSSPCRLSLELPLTLIGSRYVFLQLVAGCGALDGRAITVQSSLGGVVTGVIR
jgi:hypothetical protein